MDSNEKMGIRRVFKNILSIMGGYKLKFVITGIFALLSVLFTVYSPILLGDAINIIFDGSEKIINHTGTIDFSALINVLILVATLYFLSAAFDYLQTYLLKETTMEISYSLRKKVINKVLYLPMDTIDKNQRGETISRLINDVKVLETALTTSFIEITRIVLVMIVSLIIMLAYNVWLTIIIILIVLFSSGFIGYI